MSHFTMKTTAFIICLLCTITKFANGRALHLEDDVTSNRYSFRGIEDESAKITDRDWSDGIWERPLELKHHDYDYGWAESDESAAPGPVDNDYEHERTEDELDEMDGEEYRDWFGRLEFKHHDFDYDRDESDESLAPGLGDIEYEHEGNEAEFSKFRRNYWGINDWEGPPKYGNSRFNEFLHDGDDYVWTESDESVAPGNIEDDYESNEDESAGFVDGYWTGDNQEGLLTYDPSLHNDEFLPDDEDYGQTESHDSWNRDAYRRIESESADITIGAFADKDWGILLGVDDGSVACYESVDFGRDYAIQIEIQLSSSGISAPPGSYGRIAFSIDSSKNEPFTTVHVGTTHDWEVFSTQKQFFHDSITGVHDVCLTFHSNVREDSGFVDIDWFRFHK